MCMAYENSKTKGMNYWNLIEPMYLNVAINLNNDYNPRYKDEDFKYRVCVLCSKIILAVSPPVVKDIFQLQAYLEMQSYIKALKRYRPIIQIKSMIDECKKRPTS